MNQCGNMLSNSSNDVYIQISNYGGFMAEFYVTYIDPMGIEHNEDSGAFSLGFSRRINIVPGTRTVGLKVELWIFGGNRIIYDGYMGIPGPSCFGLYHTIFDATFEPISCNSVGGGLPTPPNNSNCCCCCCCPCPYTCSCPSVYNSGNSCYRC
ncbi:hypothetical protein [Clostridium botulinum]|uniref:hypothetical protein n=1 Tax=Clostridium botulinum TaxID=1491 RepID=UPI000363223E|nr:hypothetical protein [Clostridium botulinum]KEH96836.1 hypothetical protein Z953_13910 [Clostridium botulinum D str. 16868]KLU74513.1 hypothetical protein CBC3_13305 [Clostridium botulinum V891]KOA73655.1 hypothetical protein ADU78_11795 [Clostridium botulinum]KOA89278.1 hypothetical protein ADU76_14535 [Clostridium botulinum]KOC32408.1 hypothetical protein ADU81_11710 [Clostridium botulinum]